MIPDIRSNPLVTNTNHQPPRATSSLKELMTNDSGFAFDPRTGFTYIISPTGLAIIAWLKEGLSGDALIARLLDTFEVAEATAAQDCAGFLTALRKYGLLRPEEEVTG